MNSEYKSCTCGSESECKCALKKYEYKQQKPSLQYFLVKCDCDINCICNETVTKSKGREYELRTSYIFDEKRFQNIEDQSSANNRRQLIDLLNKLFMNSMFLSS